MFQIFAAQSRNFRLFETVCSVEILVFNGKFYTRARVQTRSRELWVKSGNLFPFLVLWLIRAVVISCPNQANRSTTINKYSNSHSKEQINLYHCSLTRFSLGLYGYRKWNHTKLHNTKRNLGRHEKPWKTRNRLSYFWTFA